MKSTESSRNDLPKTDTTGRRGRTKKEENVRPQKTGPPAENRRMTQQFAGRNTQKKIDTRDLLHYYPTIPMIQNLLNRKTSKK